MNKFFKDTMLELSQVVWPTRARTIQYTLLVVAISVLVAYYLGLFDVLFAKGVAALLAR